MPLTTIRNKQATAYGLLPGYNTDEMNLFLIPTGVLKKIKCPLVLNIAIRKVHPTPVPLIALFRKKYPKKNLGEIFSAILTSYQAQVPAIRFANANTALGGKLLSMSLYGLHLLRMGYMIHAMVLKCLLFLITCNQKAREGCWVQREAHSN